MPGLPGPPSAFRTRRPPPGVQRSVWTMGLLLGATLLVWMFSGSPLLDQLRHLGHDRLLRSLPAAGPTREVALLDIDERSLSAEGQWPWPRYRVAQLLDAAHRAGARAIALDLLFAEPDRLSLARLRDSFQQDLQVDIGLSRVPADRLDNDAILARSLAASRAVLGLWFAFEPGAGTAPPAGLPLPPVLFHAAPGAPERAPLPEATGALPALPALTGTARACGFLNALPDGDGKIRRSPLLIRHGARIYPSLALAAVLRAEGGGQLQVRSSRAGIEEVQAGPRRIPTDRQGNLLLPFRPGFLQRFARVSATDLLAGRGAEPLKGRIVFLGSTATAEGDVHPVPFERQVPGLLSHAAAAEAILRGDFLQAPAWAAGLDLLLSALAIAAMTWSLARHPLWVSALACGGGVALLAFGARALLLQQGLLLPPVLPIIALLAGFLLPGVVRFRGEERAAIRAARDLVVAQDCAIISLVSVAQTRDRETGQHILRTRHYVRILAEHLASHPRFRRELSPEHVEAIVKSAPLHDIGKVGIPDAILQKPEGLTDGETDAMRQHPLLGKRALERADRLSGLDSKHSFLHYAEEIASTHHERWDGTGYPAGLAGEAIPISGRIMAVADVYDALRSRRRYKAPLNHEEAAARIAEESGRAFDPDVVRAFLAVQEAFVAVSEQLPDEEETLP